MARHARALENRGDIFGERHLLRCQRRRSQGQAGHDARDEKTCTQGKPPIWQDSEVYPVLEPPTQAFLAELPEIRQVFLRLH
jgi:hypothetical protein